MTCFINFFPSIILGFQKWDIKKLCVRTTVDLNSSTSEGSNLQHWHYYMLLTYGWIICVCKWNRDISLSCYQQGRLSLEVNPHLLDSSPKSISTSTHLLDSSPKSISTGTQYVMWPCTGKSWMRYRSQIQWIRPRKKLLLTLKNAQLSSEPGTV